MMALNWLMVFAGLAVCFGGLCLKRVFSAIAGFAAGVLCSFFIAFFKVGIWYIDDESILVTCILVGFLFTAVCGLFFRIGCIINGIATGVLLSLLLYMFMGRGRTLEMLILMMVFAGIVFGLIAYYLAEISFMAQTAVIGALTACIGFDGIREGYELSELFWYLSDNLGTILLGTMVLAALGFGVQFYGVFLRRPAEAATQQGIRMSGGSSAWSTEEKAVSQQRIRMSGGPAAWSAGENAVPQQGIRMSGGSSAWSTEEKAASHQRMRRSGGGRHTIQDPLLLVAPVLSYVWMPIYYRICYNIAFYSPVWTIITTVSAVIFGIVMGELVYCAEKNKHALNMIIAAISAVCVAIFDHIFQWGDFLTAILFMLRFAVCAAVLFLIEKLAVPAAVKRVIMILWTNFYILFASYWIMYGYSGIYFDREKIITIAACVAAVLVLGRMEGKPEAAAQEMDGEVYLGSSLYFNDYSNRDYRDGYYY